MGHDNINKEIKKKLEERLLEPSSMAWDKLNSKLDAVEKKEKKSFPFYWVAACMVIFFGMFWFFKTQNQETLIEPSQEIVKQDIKSMNNQLKEFNKEKVLIESVVYEKQVPQLVSNQKKLIVKPLGNNIKNEKFIEESNESSIVQNIITDPIKEEQEVLVASNDKDNKLNFEVDSLLSDAMASLENNDAKKVKSQKGYQVDADALLADVEEELDLSFKEKVFKKIKQGFKKTKTAVAKRND